MVQCKYVFFTLGFVLLALLIIPFPLDGSSSTEEEKSFQQFMTQHNRSYLIGSTEYHQRLANFKVSLTTIRNLNGRRNHADSAVFGITQFTDMSAKEFEKQILSEIVLSNSADYQRRNHHRHQQRIRDLSLDLPDSLDWKTKGMVTLVKDQRLCGACWAFSIIETVESMVAIKHQVLQDLSVQQGIDCAKGNNVGCGGGDTCDFAKWLSSNKVVIPPATSYPYLGHDALCLRVPSSTGGAQVASNFTCQNFVDKEEKLLAMLAGHGPLAVAVNALPWQFYVSGVIDGDCANSAFSLNHAVQITGYDLGAAVPYYFVRNSWGALWGERGYARLAFGKNKCGVANRVTSLDVL